MIRLEGVTKRYRSAAGERVALDAVDLHVAKGQVFGVVGRSGAGKSTLIRTINRLETPDGGRVVVGGQDITAMKPAELRAARRRIGMIFQHFNLLNAKTIAENVAFPSATDTSLPTSLCATRPSNCPELISVPCSRYASSSMRASEPSAGRTT